MRCLTSFVLQTHCAALQNCDFENVAVTLKVCLPLHHNLHHVQECDCTLPIRFTKLLVTVYSSFWFSVFLRLEMHLLIYPVE